MKRTTYSNVLLTIIYLFTSCSAMERTDIKRPREEEVTSSRPRKSVRRSEGAQDTNAEEYFYSFTKDEGLPPLDKDTRDNLNAELYEDLVDRSTSTVAEIRHYLDRPVFEPYSHKLTSQSFPHDDEHFLKHFLEILYSWNIFTLETLLEMGMVRTNLKLVRAALHFGATVQSLDVQTALEHLVLRISGEIDAAASHDKETDCDILLACVNAQLNHKDMKWSTDETAYFLSSLGIIKRYKAIYVPRKSTIKELIQRLIVADSNPSSTLWYLLGEDAEPTILPLKRLLKNGVQMETPDGEVNVFFPNRYHEEKAAKAFIKTLILYVRIPPNTLPNPEHVKDSTEIVWNFLLCMKRIYPWFPKELIRKILSSNQELAQDVYSMYLANSKALTRYMVEQNNGQYSQKTPYAYLRPLLTKNALELCALVRVLKTRVFVHVTLLLNEKDNNAETPQEVARAQGLEEVAQLLDPANLEAHFGEQLEKRIMRDLLRCEKDSEAQNSNTEN